MNKNKKFWTGDIEMNIACYIFGISVALYKNITINLSDNLNNNIPIMIISHINSNHYNLLY